MHKSIRESQRAVVELFDMANSMVGDIWKSREKIESHVSASANPTFAKKTEKTSFFRPITS